MVRKLGELEALVMEQLWSSSEPLPVRTVLEALPDGRNRAFLRRRLPQCGGADTAHARTARSQTR